MPGHVSRRIAFQVLPRACQQENRWYNQDIDKLKKGALRHQAVRAFADRIAVLCSAYMRRF
jgi:hypothetical protein